MFIAGLGLAVPPRRYSQLECWAGFQAAPQFARLQPRSRKLLKKVLDGTNGIEGRHLALESMAEAFDLRADALQARFALHAPELATLAAQRALQDAGLAAADVDALLVSTCTGYLCPGLTSYVAERLGLRPQAQLLDLVGQGCGAAIPNLRTGAAMIAGGAERVLSVCVEVCSAAFYLDDDPGVLISAALFGDGAAAAVLSGRHPAGRRAVQWRSAGTLLRAAERDLLRFEHREGMLRNILRPEVPGLAAQFAGEVLEQTLAAAGVASQDIKCWVLHAGGRDVLAALRERLALGEAETARSAAVLREFGNMSSPFALFVLERALRENAPGGYWWLASFGAGFSSHGALLEVE